MISRIFIDRPIFAWVISIIIMSSGIGAIGLLPIEHYPDISPPSVNIRASYPGASAETLEASVTQVLEQQLTGLDGLLYFSSTSSSQGAVTINATFGRGTDADVAQMQVQNKSQQAIPRLPQIVQQQGVSVAKASSDYLLIVSLYDTTDESTTGDVADYIASNLQDSVSRLPGVGELRLFGAPHAMRIWLDPFKLSGFRLMPDDVRAAVLAQNTQVAAGQLGAQPAPSSQMLNVSVTAKSRLQTPEQFRNIIVRSNVDGSSVRLGDVARVELGSEDYASVTRVNGHPGASMAVLLAPDADALQTAERVKAEVERRAKSFPPGYRYAFPRDGTTFVRRSIREVLHTLLEAVVLVVLVMLVFLQSWRATLIPAIAIPVVVLGTFGVLAACGFTINTLTLFGLVLAIGLLVDDAIVVVENVERVMHEQPGIDARQATIQSMNEIQTALIAIALVLSAVFLPMAFFPGTTGVIYRQFSVTLVSSMALSVIVALVLTPALTAGLMVRSDRSAPHRLGRFGARWRGWFDRSFERSLKIHQWSLGHILSRPIRFACAYAVMAAILVLLFWRLPTSFLPTEDEGATIVQYTLPSGATQTRSLKVTAQIEDYFLGAERRNVDTLSMIVGFGYGGSGQNTGLGFALLSPWDERPGEMNSAINIARRATRALSGIPDARVIASTPPPVRGLGQTSGFTMQLLNSGDLSREEFKALRDRLLAEAAKDPMIVAVRPSGLEDTTTLHVDIDEAKVAALGISHADVYTTLAAAWGGNYINDFIDGGRVKRVYMQGDAPHRASPADLDHWSVRSAEGGMASFSSFARTSWVRAPAVLTRFGGLPSFEIQGQAAPGNSSGDAMLRIERLASDLSGVSVAWSGLSYQERASSGQALTLYLLSLFVVFLCLAALYESWLVPLAVLLVIPIGLLGAVLAVFLRGLQNDIFFQVGLLTTMGLSAKNAILIVEFAEQAVRRGKGAVAAAMEGTRLRLRPIVMTSLAFAFGVVPLAISSGAGAQSRIAIGTTVLGGVLAATLIAVFYVPLFFVVLRGAVRHARPRHLSTLALPSIND
jgi:multidrug efflux pump